METKRSLNQLYDIVNDLWGQSGAAPESAAPSGAPHPVPEAFPPFEQFWRTADETVDWTDALAYEHCPDGMTSPVLWSFFHEHANAVLHGDLAAYVEVLKTANPLSDLLPYACGFHVKAENADRLTVSFEGLPQYLNTAENERRRYLSGICLRAARDLMALLPVCETQVTAKATEAPLLNVTFTRQQLQKARFSFVDPVAFVAECGGQFAA